MKEAVNQRFISAVNYLLDSNTESNKYTIAQKLGLKTSMFSEILKKRVNVGIEHIIRLKKNWNISYDWILDGSGEMIKLENNIKNLDFKELAESRKETAELLREKIKNLEEEISQLKKAKENPSGYGMVAESKQKLKSK